MNDLRLYGPQHLRNSFADKRRPVRFFERPARPVVDQLDDRQSVVDAPRDEAVRTRRVELGAKNADVMACRERAAQLERVNLGTRLVAREKIVDRVKDAQVLIIASGRERALEGP